MDDNKRQQNKQTFTDLCLRVELIAIGLNNFLEKYEIGETNAENWRKEFKAELVNMTTYCQKVQEAKLKDLKENQKEKSKLFWTIFLAVVIPAGISISTWATVVHQVQINTGRISDLEALHPRISK